MSDARVEVAAAESLRRHGMALPEAWAELLSRAAAAVLDHQGVGEAELSLTLMDDVCMAELNERWLGHVGPTDVLSFPLHAAGEPPAGDVYIGLEQAARQADELGVPLDEELVRLAVHGTLHVLGHDHPEGEGRETSAMWRTQESIVSRLLEGGEAAPGEGGV
ncbi:MAG TPA: rRNA maturation RNase YbeY [Longimicrobiales bacterium]|nr:rRNA maturation RNase YbeY [Longimicrobiales bacterium]